MVIKSLNIVSYIQNQQRKKEKEKEILSIICSWLKSLASPRFFPISFASVATPKITAPTTANEATPMFPPPSLVRLAAGMHQPASQPASHGLTGKAALRAVSRNCSHEASYP